MTYRIGIIGCGGMGRSHAQHWQQRDDTTVVVVVIVVLAAVMVMVMVMVMVFWYFDLHGSWVHGSG